MKIRVQSRPGVTRESIFYKLAWSMNNKRLDSLDSIGWDIFSSSFLVPDAPRIPDICILPAYYLMKRIPDICILPAYYLMLVSARAERQTNWYKIINQEIDKKVIRCQRRFVNDLSWHNQCPNIGADLRIDLKSFVEISDGSFPITYLILCLLSLALYLICILPAYYLISPLPFLHRLHHFFLWKTIETGEIRVGKAMVRDKGPAANSP